MSTTNTGLAIKAQATISNRIFMLFAGFASAMAIVIMPFIASATPKNADKGFNSLGQNDTARVFVGTCYEQRMSIGMTEAAARNWCGVWSEDQVVMKWNKAWDDCNAAGNDDEAACAGAWLTNQWNGHVPGGSGETWQYKYIWVGSALEDSPYWRDGGEPIWRNYETITSRGNDASGHVILTHVKPNGLGN